jgi:copper chaperone CopZ
MDTIKFRIKNFNCEACIKLSESMISEIPGVKSVDVKNLQGETELEAERDISLSEIQKALEGTNYEVEKL